MKTRCFYSILLSFVFYCEIKAQTRTSPCPKVFAYKSKNEQDNRWDGVITIQSNEALEGIWIQVSLDQPADILGNWFGDSQPSDNNRQFSIRDPNYKLEAGPPVLIDFFVKYSAAKIVPSVKKIKLNGRVICQDGVGTFQTTTPKLYISVNKGGANSGNTHRNPSQPSLLNNGNTNRRPTTDSSSNSDRNSGVDNKGDSSLNSRPTRQPTKNDDNCGRVAMQATPLISHGQNTSQGQWPWHAAIFKTVQAEFTYQCGGTLISRNHVLTAAHCVTHSGTNRKVDVKSLAIYLGKYSLKKFSNGGQDREVDEIFVHPEFNHNRFFNDIAIVRLDSPAELTNYVRVCCLWKDSADIRQIENQKGTVVGWGFTEYQIISDTLQQIKMPIISKENCIYSKPEFYSQFTFANNYCAGERNGSSVCNGDSGGGMVFPVSGTSGSRTQWQIRGIVSIGSSKTAENGLKICDSNNYMIFTDVAKYLEWIQGVIN